MADFVAVSYVLGSLQQMEVVLLAKTKPLLQKISKHRALQRDHSLERMEDRGPDIGTQAFKEAASLQAMAVAMSGDEPADQAFVDAISDC